MLANKQSSSVTFGQLRSDVHLNLTSIHELIKFIADRLPSWRDNPDRPCHTSETALTSQLCAYLNSEARYTSGFDYLQFRVEEGDEKKGGRKIDLVAAPCGSTVWIQGRRCTQFDTLLPIECKRLPTPKGKTRDPQEYVITRSGSTGGIQRFKAGNHGANHALAGMIAYVQDDTSANWLGKVNGWISSLNGGAHSGWTASDLIEITPLSSTPDVSIYRSSHARDLGLDEIEIRHIWINMT